MVLHDICHEVALLFKTSSPQWRILLGCISHIHIDILYILKFKNSTHVFYIYEFELFECRMHPFSFRENDNRLPRDKIREVQHIILQFPNHIESFKSIRHG